MVNWLDYFVERRNDLLGLVSRMVAVESPSLDKPAVDRMGALIAQMAEDAGGRVTIVPQEVRGNHVVARWDGAQPGILILCHIDTVHPVGMLAQNPWRMEGDKAFGPGAYDTKAGAAIILAALAGLMDVGLPPKYGVTIVFNSDEEIGTHSSRALIEEEARHARVVFCMEPSEPPNEALKVWRKGTGMYTITALGRAAHAGGNHQAGVNAIEELAHQILCIQGMTDYEVGTTTSVDVVEGGTRTNVIPSLARAQVDVRILTLAEGERIDAALRGLRPVLPGAQVVVEGGLNRPPMEDCEITRAPFRWAQAIGAELGLELAATGTGGASDGNFTAALGIPTLDGLGAAGDGAHTEQEFIYISSLPRRAALMAALLSHW
jgi:glutamate carboxypeptidase